MEALPHLRRPDTLEKFGAIANLLFAERESRLLINYRVERRCSMAGPLTEAVVKKLVLEFELEEMFARRGELNKFIKSVSVHLYHTAFCIFSGCIFTHGFSVQ